MSWLDHGHCWRAKHGLKSCPKMEAADLLTIPDVRQKTDSDCGEAAYQAVLKYYGIRPGSIKPDPLDGTHPFYLETSFRLASLRVSSGEMDIDDLRYHVRRGRPVVCLIRHQDSGHYVIVRGVRGSKVYYHCPLSGECSLPVLSWQSCWLDRDRMGTQYRSWGLAAWVE